MQVAVGESPGVRRKPHPDAVLEAMRRLNATPSETLYVGDSESIMPRRRRRVLLARWYFGIPRRARTSRTRCRFLCHGTG